jgi:arginase family enzyme
MSFALSVRLYELSKRSTNIFDLTNAMRMQICLDVLDPFITPANSYAVADGFSKEELFETIELFIEHHILCH